jgi:lipopolysaccharide/colanic/teichoic acid biosynthesis glycosyltransferase
MGKNTINSNLQNKTDSSIALSSAVTAYGKSVVVGRGFLREDFPKDSPWKIFRFYFAELFTGVLFATALFIYISMVPERKQKPIRHLLSMIDKGLKKLLDTGGSLAGLIVALPFLVIIAILIKLDSRGPVFYTQERVGINRRRRHRRIFMGDVNNDNRIRERRRFDAHGRPFRVMKFRTMIHNAEKESGPVWAQQNDHRITTIGKFLRKTRIDEIPQLINVLKGDMSLVGPRPERPVFVADLSRKVPDYDVRLRVKPGITGLAQVTSGYDSSVDSVVEKVSHDVKYIRSWSFFTDLKILAKTVLVVITGKGAC